jgi:endonuclease/exonuclease/phosphatase family metal-dependent hydrolase
MNEITVGSWNALNAFGDENLSEARMNAAFEIVKRLDVDVLAVQETSRHSIHGSSIEQARLEEMSERMHAEGYSGQYTQYTSYVDERNAHNLSLWTRLDTPMNQEVRTYGRRHALYMAFPELGVNVHALHLHDKDVWQRTLSTGALLRSELRSDHEAIVLADSNEMCKRDPKGTIPRMIGRVVSGFEVSDYYDPSKRFQRLAGKVIRTCRMAEGRALQLFENAGYHDADPTMQPTIGRGRLAFQLDRILGTSGVTFSDFEVQDRSVLPDSEPISDHSPIRARAAF